MADIDASETTKWNNGRGFVPVGSKDNPFTGVLHGNGHTIRNLYIKRGGEKEVGLLRILSGSGEVRNLKLVDADVSGMRNVGALVGHSLGRITECYASGKLWCEAGGGGLVGCSAGNITQCNASVVLSGAIVGGLVGFNSGNITKCLTSGEVCGGMAGGLAGGNVGIITECYASGKVSGQPVGGLVGQNDKAGKITESYWDIHATGQQASSGGGLGKTTDEMKRQDTFAGWNFDQTWQIEEAKAYPALRWFAARAVSGRAQAAPGATTAQAGGKCFEPTKNLNSPKLTVDLGVADIRAKAEEGDAQAQVNLGLLYEKGRQGVTQDEVEAVEWYRKAARQNNAEAEWRLGVCYAYGIGVAKDEKMAAELYREAAEQNNAEAQLNLGTCYAFGRCVEADAVEAYKWYLLAAAQDKELGRNIPMVERLMSPEQIAEGRRRAGKFRPK